jgi:dimethylhistidine N-methyltransferase
MNDLLGDVLKGLGAEPKYLESKYFYDDVGDEIFREIMASSEYYLTRCEMEIFVEQSKELASAICGTLQDFDVVELGPGDATKSVHLLKALANRNVNYTYYPIDISGHVIAQLSDSLPKQVEGIKVQGLNGEYFDMLNQLKTSSGRHKVVLFLGSNIGNIPLEYTVDFFAAIRSHLLPGDMIITGFDLKKDPKIILPAYNDAVGITKRFNLNLLKRINNTLGADFDLTQFDHRPEYDVNTGAMKSYLESRKDQQVRIGEHMAIDLKKGERIFMEISQKYTVEQTDDFAEKAGFTPVQHYYDSKNWFLDALWQAGDPVEEVVKVKEEVVSFSLVEELQPVK